MKREVCRVHPLKRCGSPKEGQEEAVRGGRRRWKRSKVSFKRKEKGGIGDGDGLRGGGRVVGLVGKSWHDRATT